MRDRQLHPTVSIGCNYLSLSLICFEHTSPRICKAVEVGHVAWHPLLVLSSWYPLILVTLRWRHDERDGVSNHQPHDCLLNRLFRRRLKKTSKLCVTGLCAGNSPGTGEFRPQRANNAEDGSIWWRHYDVSTTHFDIGYPKGKSTIAWSSDE